MNTSSIEHIDLKDIRQDGGTQSRFQINDETVSEYADAMQAGDEFPPITVFFDGSVYWLADGFHRVAAAKEAGQTTLAADIKQGERRDAVLFSAGANAKHGLRRRQADIKRAVEMLLRDDEWRQWSDRELARRAAVSPKTVGKYRRELSEEFPQMSERVVKRGDSEYTVKTDNIGSKPKAPTPDATPEPKFRFGMMVQTPRGEIGHVVDASQASVIVSTMNGERPYKRDRLTIIDNPPQQNAEAQLAKVKQTFTHTASLLRSLIPDDPHFDRVALVKHIETLKNQLTDLQNKLQEQS